MCVLSVCSKCSFNIWETLSFHQLPALELSMVLVWIDEISHVSREARFKKKKTLLIGYRVLNADRCTWNCPQFHICVVVRYGAVAQVLAVPTEVSLVCFLFIILYWCFWLSLRFVAWLKRRCMYIINWWTLSIIKSVNLVLPTFYTLKWTCAAMIFHLSQLGIISTGLQEGVGAEGLYFVVLQSCHCGPQSTVLHNSQTLVLSEWCKT